MKTGKLLETENWKMKIKAKHSLGQNFLINPHILDKIVAAAEIEKDDIILEVGPGPGNLTKKLAEKAGRVIAIEKDRRLIEGLREKFKNSNVEIIEGDVLKVESKKLKVESGQYKIVANIPYYITSNFLRTVFDPAGSKDTAGHHSEKGRASNGARKWPRPKLIVLMIQKEVAQRIVAKPPDMNLLALSVQLYSEPKIISYVSKNNFRPAPKVDSAIIKLEIRDKQQETNSAEFFKLIKAGFAGKRKQLINNLNRNLGLDREIISTALTKLGLKKDIRAENLSLEQWIRFSQFLL